MGVCMCIMRICEWCDYNYICMHVLCVHRVNMCGMQCFPQEYDQTGCGGGG